MRFEIEEAARTRNLGADFQVPGRKKKQTKESLREKFLKLEVLPLLIAFRRYFGS